MNLFFENLPWILLFLGILLFIEALYYVLRGMREGEVRAVNRRMRMLQSNRPAEEVRRLLLRDHQDGFSRVIARAVPWMERLLVQSGSGMSLRRLCAVMVVLGIVATIVMKIVTFTSPILAIVAGMVIGFALPTLFLVIRRRRRQNRFLEQLPDALDLMVRSLRAGHPISVTMATVASEMEDPIGTEFGMAVDEMTYGLTLYESLVNMTHRNRGDDLRFFAVAIQIQHQVGGNLAEVISNIEEVIRDRFRMFAKVRAISAEGRFSGWVIGLLPIFVWGILHLVSPKFYGSVQGDPLFLSMMMVAGGLLLIGAFVIWRMVNFKI